MRSKPKKSFYLCNYIVIESFSGTGLDTRKNAIIIKANLGGNILETDAVVPGDLTASFKNNLIWSTNKEAIKRLVIAIK